MAIALLVWREAAVKSGMESGAMSAFRGVIVFSTYLAFFEWTRSLDPSLLGDKTEKPLPKIIGAELAKFVVVSTLVLAVTYKIAPHNVNPEAVWWVSIIGISMFAVWLWRNADQPNRKVTDAKSTKPSSFQQAPVWVVGFLVVFAIFLIVGIVRS